jgi:hypothetical protein
MTSRRRVRARRALAASPSRPRGRSILIAVASCTFVALASIAVVVATRGGSVRHPVMAGSLPSEPSIHASGVARAGGIQVDGASIDMGLVPLNTTVTPTWRLRNTGSVPVVLGEPHVEVMDGCCPGKPQFEASSLAPGEETTLTFPLIMHEGMDGPHDFRLHVSVGGEVLELQVTADFG